MLDLDASEEACRRAWKAYQDMGRQIFEVTIERKLQNFPQVEYSPLFD